MFGHQIRLNSVRKTGLLDPAVLLPGVVTKGGLPSSKMRFASARNFGTWSAGSLRVSSAESCALVIHRLHSESASHQSILSKEDIPERSRDIYIYNGCLLTSSPRRWLVYWIASTGFWSAILHHGPYSHHIRHSKVGKREKKRW